VKFAGFNQKRTVPKPLLGLFLVSTSEFHSKSVKRVNVAISASCVSPFVAKRIDSGATHITEKITLLPQQNAFFFKIWPQLTRIVVVTISLVTVTTVIVVITIH